MTSQEARIITNERHKIAAIIERNQQKLHNQMRGNSAEWSRWAIANQWLALEKQRLQILCRPDYREEATANFHSHKFPGPMEEAEAEEAPTPKPLLPNFDAVKPDSPKPKRGRRPKSESQPTGAAPQSQTQKGTKKAR